MEKNNKKNKKEHGTWNMFFEGLNKCLFLSFSFLFFSTSSLNVISVAYCTGCYCVSVWLFALFCMV